MHQSKPSANHWVLGVLSSVALLGSVVHCSAESDTGDIDNGAKAGAGGDGLNINVGGSGGSSKIDHYENDPLPENCSGGGEPPPDPGGTLECPGDKNLPGCPCVKEGDTAACWPGFRKNRDRGICKDGTATCRPAGEHGYVWGDCEGYILPIEGVTEGAGACQCFSAGRWELDNTSPCFAFSDQANTVVVGAFSTVVDQAGNSACPATIPTTTPTEEWAKNRLTVDCAGFFKLCYTIKAGDIDNKQASDCEVTKVCTETHYGPKDSVVEFPALPGWMSNNVACAQEFVTNGGYGEMSVEGESDECDTIGPKVFQSVNYCPFSCNGPNPPAMCANCTQGGSGGF